MALYSRVVSLENQVKQLQAEVDSLREEKKRSQEIQSQLKESETRWQLVLRGNNDGIWDWNLKTGELFFSERWKEMLGYKSDELPNHINTWKQLLHPDDLERVMAVLQKHLEGKSNHYIIEFRLRCKNNSYKWILSRGQALWDEQGQPIRMAGSHTDISDRKQKETSQKLQAKRDHLLSKIARQLIDKDIDTAINFTLQVLGKFTGSGRGYIIHYSESQNQWNMSYEWCNMELPIHPFINQFQAISIEKFPWISQQLLSGKTIRINQLTDVPLDAIAERTEIKNSVIPCRLIVPMINAGKTVAYLGLNASENKQWSKEEVNLLKLVGEFIAIAQARHEAESKLRTAKEEAEAANRAKSEFLASMSHELRTPLNAILGFTQIMNRDANLSEEHRNNIEIISRSGEHLLELINDILEMSKIEAGRTTFNPNNFDLHQLLDNLEDMLSLKAKAKGLQLIFEREIDLLPYIQTDEGKLRQVLINLLGNALKFTEEGGVTLRVKVISLIQNNLKIRFEVEDTGPGIDAAEIDKLFEAFGQTEVGRNSQQGTGLGLPISKKFVELMGGEIRVSSILGNGSLFTFEIQATKAEANQIKANYSHRKVIGLAPDQPQYRILAVDDRLESRILLVKLLSSIGFEVKEATNGQEAVNLSQHWHPHLIWMDMRMPVMDGYEATKQIKSTIQGQATVIIALTASAFEEERTIVLSAGCDDFMRKPFREEVLWEKMAQHLGVRYLYEDNINRTVDVVYPTSISEKISDQIGIMPLKWLEKLQQAAQECSDEEILELINQIPPQYTDLMHNLQDLARNFLFEQIIELTNIVLQK
jgi:two-component system sensor histidine kinase/response regulator